MTAPGGSTAGTAPGAVLLPTASGARTGAAVGELLRPRWALAVAALVAVAAATGVGLLTAPILGHLVDLAVDGHRAAAMTTPFLFLVVVAVVAGALTVVGESLVARLGEDMLAELRERLVARALRLPLERVEAAGTGDLTARVTNDVGMIADVVRSALPQFARAGLTIGLTLVGIAVLDWRFLLAALLATPVQAATVRWYARTAPPVYATQRIAAGAQQQQLLETVGGAATVRAFHLSARQLGRVEERSATAVRWTLSGTALITRFFGRLNLAEFIGLAAVLSTGFLLVRHDAVSIGTATAAALYFHNLFNPINAALSLVDDAQAAGASLARLVGVIDLPDETATAAAPPPQGTRAADGNGRRTARPPAEASSVVSTASVFSTASTGPAPAGVLAGAGQQVATARPVAPGVLVEPSAASVSVARVTFGYRPGHDVLRDVDLTVRAGERVALVGASGAGKTTLAKLIAGIHLPSRGSVSIGGVPLDELGPAATRRTVALVTQEVHVFAGLLTDDLRLAAPGATDDELRAALDTVGALAWVQLLPAGLDTVVGEGGHRLTVAQAQQLALARLVLADPPVAILDEATAEAGSAAARALDAAADAALRGRTAILVAHRLAQAATADRVVVLDEGRVVESGPHAELLTTPGPYATLWSAWTAHRPDAPGGSVPPLAPRRA
ncbi:ABC transporter ATP-binding protein [Pseudofrankia sp. BMG5.36]|uniref:ABC transporter ATP-binding protein n=1 Tax=Pseudofrankia sp. BMG5.36 TaxID=1834512 RepID=UPI0009F7242A|nr:ABC transporter ATP-binding protein [Pseudofrankia sp. BMG5.36]